MEKREEYSEEGMVGYLSDQKAAFKVASLLKKEGFQGVEVVHRLDQRAYLLKIAPEQDLPQARELYRVCMGLPPTSRKIDPQLLVNAAVPLGTGTLVLILLSVAAWAAFQFQLFPRVVEILSISNSAREFLPEVRQGQVWRLITPALLHFNLFHIFFNMVCLKQFGSIQEHAFGKVFFVSFFLGTALLSNVSQYLAAGSHFGGMSGVVFAQMGFLWSYQKCDETFPYGLPREMVVVTVIWFLLCLAGVFFFKVANTAHAVGLAGGILVSLALAWRRGLRPPFFSHIALALGIVAITIGVEFPGLLWGLAPSIP